MMDEDDSFEVEEGEVPGYEGYPLQAWDMLFIATRLTGNLLSTLAGGVHAFANEFAAAGNHQRRTRAEAQEQEKFAMDAVTALDRLTGGKS